MSLIAFFLRVAGKRALRMLGASPIITVMASVLGGAAVAYGSVPRLEVEEGLFSAILLAGLAAGTLTAVRGQRRLQPALARFAASGTSPDAVAKVVYALRALRAAFPGFAVIVLVATGVIQHAHRSLGSALPAAFYVAVGAWALAVVHSVTETGAKSRILIFPYVLISLFVMFVVFVVDVESRWAVWGITAAVAALTVPLFWMRSGVFDRSRFETKGPRRRKQRVHPAIAATAHEFGAGGFPQIVVALTIVAGFVYLEVLGMEVLGGSGAASAGSLGFLRAAIVGMTLLSFITGIDALESAAWRFHALVVLSFRYQLLRTCAFFALATLPIYLPLLILDAIRDWPAALAGASTLALGLAFHAFLALSDGPSLLLKAFTAGVVTIGLVALYVTAPMLLLLGPLIAVPAGSLARRSFYWRAYWL